MFPEGKRKSAFKIILNGSPKSDKAYSSEKGILVYWLGGFHT